MPRLYRIFVLLCAVLIWQTGSAQQKSIKKGIAYGYHSIADMEALTPGISWWYNWYHQPESGVVDSYHELEMDFVPMAWNGAFNEIAMREFLDDHPDVQYLLGFNEPNFVSQANMTPQQAADAWPALEAIADEYNLKLVAPAVNYCDVCVDIPGNNDNDPTAWLDAFFSECSDCRVDYVAVHWYACDVGALDWYLGLFEKYNRHVWVTELACWEGNPTLENQKDYMIGAIDLMEQDTHVHRYAWFTGRSSGPNIDLLNSGSGDLSELGELYVNFLPIHDTTHYTRIPARIEAENYTRMSGALLEATTDTDGFANVGWLDAGDWLEYNIEVSEEAEYQFKLRTAGMAAGDLALRINNAPIQNISIPPTGGWQNWTTITSTLHLIPGMHKLRLHLATAGFNLNWLQIGSDEMVATETLQEIHGIRIFPQPLSSKLLSIQVDEFHEGDWKVELHDLIGTLVYSSQHNIESTTFQVDLPEHVLQYPGVYILTLSNEKHRYLHKVMVG